MRIRRHPQTKDQLRWVFVKVGIPGLVGIFVALLALLAALLALGLQLDSARPGTGYLELWRDQLMALLYLPIDVPDANTGSAVAQVIAVAQGLIAIVLPALYVGAVVFRLFVHPDVFVFRRTFVLMPSPETFRGELDQDGHVLAIRTYNGSRMRALDVRFDVVHQHWHETNGGSIVRNIDLPTANAKWPMADRHVPFTLFVCLADGDVTATDGCRRLRAINGRELHPKDRLVVHVRGAMPELGQSFVERHAFDLAGVVSDAPYGGVDIKYGARSSRWSGWASFDD